MACMHDKKEALIRILFAQLNVSIRQVIAFLLTYITTFTILPGTTIIFLGA